MGLLKRNVKKYSIDITGTFFSIEDVKRLIEITDYILIERGGNSELEINLKNADFKEFDISLIGYLIACWQKSKRFFITITLPSVTKEKNNERHGLINRLKSYCLYSIAICKKTIFKIIYQETGEVLYLDKGERLRLHRTFCPIFPVGDIAGEDLYDILFELPLFLNEKTTKLAPKSGGNQSLSKPYQELGMLAYDRCLEIGRVKKIVEFEKLKSKGAYPSAGRLHSECAEKYYNAIKPIFEELKVKPVAFVCTYYLILQNIIFPDYPPKSIQEKSRQELYKDSLVETMTNLWFFTKALFHGINELAKNISEHSTTKKGVITLRAYGSHYLDRVQDYENHHKLKAFIVSLKDIKSDELRCLIDVTVTDLGDKGVSTTLIENSLAQIENVEKSPETISVAKKSLIESLKKDIDELSDKESGIGKLLSFTSDPLNQQQKRTIAHIGLLSLANLVRANNGKIIGSSTKRYDGNIIRDYYAQESLNQLLPIFPTNGTTINILLPVIKGKTYQPVVNSDFNIVRELAIEDVKSYEELLRIDPQIDQLNVNQKSKDKQTIKCICLKRYDEINFRQLEQEVVNDVVSEIDELVKEYENVTVCLNFESLKGRKFTASQLFRIIASFELFSPSANLVIYNLKNELVEELIDLNTIYCEINKNVDYWNSDKPTILLSYVDHEERRFYFTDVLWGESIGDFYAINKIIDKVHYNSVVMRMGRDDENAWTENGANPDFSFNPFFINRNVLLPIDLILKCNGKTLFEYSSIFLLRNELLSKKIGGDITLTQKLLNAPGYKISNTHFKIGAKIHASDFYYAKRFFQNSFFASRFAYLLAVRIFAILSSTVPNISNIALIGYGIYSELLISLARKFLLAIYEGNVDISDNLIEDDVNLELIKSTEITANNRIIIVPIASTFSTGFKIKEKIKNQIEQEVFYLSVLLACDDKFDKLEDAFGWMEVDEEKRIVKVQHTNDDSLTNQHYFLKVPTVWQSPVGEKKCIHCFPEKASDAKALFSTDKTAVNPSLIFDLPRARKVENQTHDIKLAENHIRYGYYNRNRGHFIYSVIIDEFLNDNKNGVDRWLGEIYDKGGLAKPTDKVILVADCHHTNMPFINMVNETVFLSSAKVLHFDSKTDYVDNFKIIYGTELADADKIYFVDDSIKSGETFNRIHFYIFTAIASNESRIIDGCITLLNKMQPKDEAWIKSKLKTNDAQNNNILSFANFHLFTSVDYRQIAPLEFEKTRYSNLSQAVFLDQFKKHFDIQKKKVLPSKQIDKLEGNKKHTPNTQMVWATHYVYELFSQIEHNSDYSFQKNFKDWPTFLESLNKNIASTTTKDALLKVLTQSPFNQFMLVKEKVFYWIVNQFYTLFDRLISEVEEDIPISLIDLRSFKFYIRRLCALDCSILITDMFLDGIVQIVDHKFDKANHKKQTTIYEDFSFDNLRNINLAPLDNVNDFCYFIVAQLIEIISKDQTRSVNVEKWLAQKLHNYSSLGQYSQKIFRLLFFENSAGLVNSFEVIKNYSNFKKLYQKEREEETIDPDWEKLVDNIAENNKIKFNPRYKILSQFLNKEPLRDNCYLTYLWVSVLLFNDKRMGNLNSKTDLIMEKLMGLFCPKEMGAFWGIHSAYKRRKDQNGPMVIYDNGKNTGGIIRSYFWQPSDLIELDNLTNISKPNNSNKAKTVFVFSRKYYEDNWTDWEDSFCPGKSLETQKPFSFLPENSDLLILIYLRKHYNDSPQAVLGFYTDPACDDNEMFATTGGAREPIVSSNTWLLAIRYLLLLREPLSQFIEYHHENYEFAELIEAQSKQFTVNLMGHGQDMILAFVQEANLPFLSTLPDNINGLRTIFSFSKDAARTKLVKKNIEYLYSTASTLTLSEIVERYQKLGNAVVESKYIEKALCPIQDLKITSDILNGEKDDVYRIDFRLLDLLVLELLVNAKKNRWLSLKDEKPLVTNKIDIRFSIEVSQDIKYLSVQVSNTGPGFAANICETLNTGRHIKRPGTISGLGLIQFFKDEIFTEDQKNKVFITSMAFREKSVMAADYKIVTASLMLGMVQ